MDNDYKQQMVHQLYTAKNAERLHVHGPSQWTMTQTTDGTSAIHSQECREVTCIMDRANGQTTNNRWYISYTQPRMQRGYMYHGPSQWTSAMTTNNRWYISYTQPRMQRGYMYHGPSQWTMTTNNRWYISYTQPRMQRVTCIMDRANGQ